MKKPIRKTLQISELLVNPDNPRFDSVANQELAMKLMLDEKGQEIKNIAQDIAARGINPSKNLIVAKSENDKFLTLEGNRRLISVILLNDPSKAKDKEIMKFFQDLKDQYTGNIPDSLECVVFENKDDARHWIMLEHTGKNEGVGVDPWNSEQRDRFIAQHRGKNLSRSVQVFDFADDNNMIRDKVDSTNLKRLVSTPHVCDVIGISFPNGKLKIKKSKSEVKKNLKKVFAEMSKDDFKVADVYTKEDRENWINKVLNIKKGQKTLPKSTARKHLIPEDCKLMILESRINDIYKELQDDLLLDSSQKATPNAVGVLFRVFLEVSLDYYLKKKIGKQPKRDKTISQKISEVTQYMEDNAIATKHELKAIRMTSSGQSTDILHIDRFHEYVHSSTIQPESDALKAKWNNVQRFFEILWGDIEKKGKKS